jgi:hypothetical protein
VDIITATKKVSNGINELAIGCNGNKAKSEENHNVVGLQPAGNGLIKTC